MALAIYYLMRGEDGWIVRFEERDYGHETLTSAIRASIAAARASAANGHEAQVLVQWPDGAWVVTWTSEENFERESEVPWTEDRPSPRSRS
ncbi:MAG: hypothetical protein WBR13_02735 [Allosphingosinicella sp.]